MKLTLWCLSARFGDSNTNVVVSDSLVGNANTNVVVSDSLVIIVVLTLTLWCLTAWLEASRAFSILGLLALVVCAVSGFLVCFLSQVKIFSTIAPLSALIAGQCALTVWWTDYCNG